MTNLSEQAVVPSSESYRLIPLTQGQFAIVDEADFEWLNQWKWHAQWSKGWQCYYARRAERNSKGRWIHLRMHNVIVRPRRGRRVDHISGATLDNRRHNLREATYRQNSINRRMRSDNTSGCPGVNWFKPDGKWAVRISLKNKRLHLGYYDLLEEAIKVRRTAETRYYGEFVRITQAPESSPLGQDC